MGEFINNIAVAASDDNRVDISWNWPAGYRCVRVAFLHRLGDRDFSEVAPEEINSVSDLCFVDEYRSVGGKYTYHIKSNETCKLRLCVYCCDMSGVPEYDKHSEVVEATGRIQQITYRISYQKSGKKYKKATISIYTDTVIPQNTLSYVVNSTNVHYPITAASGNGDFTVGPIIIGASDSIYLSADSESASGYVMQQIK